jgi:hypothetical protein
MSVRFPEISRRQVRRARRPDVTDADQAGGSTRRGALDGLGDERATAFDDRVERAAHGFG